MNKVGKFQGNLMFRQVSHHRFSFEKLSALSCSYSYSSSSNFFSLNKKISHLIRNGQLNEARAVFDKTEHKNTVTWNSMIGGYVRRREMSKARKLFEEMPEKDIVSWNTMISGYVSCGGARLLEEGRFLFDQMHRRDYISWNTIISGYAKNGKMDEAVRIFDSMPEKNTVSWNAMVTGFLQNGDVVNAVEFFERMPERDRASLSALVSGLIQNDKLDEAARVLTECGGRGRDARDAGKDDFVSAYNTLIAGYGQKRKVAEARAVFDRIPFHERNVVSWNTMIMCYVKAGDTLAAKQLFDQMSERDTFSWNTMISGYVHNSDIENGLKLFREMPDRDTLSWNMMVSGFAQIGDLESAREFFDTTPRKNMVSWNTMISGYEKNGDFKSAANLFVEMRFEGPKPDRHTLSSILTVSAGLLDINLGAQIHQIVTKTVVPDVPINNALITMYSRCGAITEARSIFHETKRDVVTWNALIGAYASHGYATEALELFGEMKLNEVKPTYITFISVLHACGHAGLVEEGREQFESMVFDYGIEPRVEHYASLVDMVSRHGKVEEAMELIDRMPFEPDNAVWGALLSACRLHNNVEVGRVAAEALMRLEPESSSPYVLLYNMYADVGRWDDATEIRMLMDKNNIKKERAKSWVDSTHM